MENSYNVKIKKYSEQAVISMYNKPVIKREVLENIIIQLKRYRCVNAQLLVDEGNGIGVYGCPWSLLDSEIRMALFDEDLEVFYEFVCLRVPCVFREKIKTEYEKEERSKITSLGRTKQKVYDLAYCNQWSLFVTLTFDDNKLMKRYNNTATDYNTCVKALHNFFTVLKRNYDSVQYLGVPELHHNFYDTRTNDIVSYNGQWFTDEIFDSLLEKKCRTQAEQILVNNVLNGTYKRRFHFHFLFNNFPSTQLVDSGEKTDGGQVIYNLLNYRLGFTTATDIKSLQASQFYITKYITKDLVAVSRGKKRYWASKNLKLPTEENVILETEDKQKIQAVLTDVIESDTRIKRLEIKNDDFENIIHKYVVRDIEFMNNDVLKEFIDFDVVVIHDYFKDIEKIMNMNSIFNPIKTDTGYVEHRGIMYKYYKESGQYKVTPLYTST